jgi:phosphoribosyl 1,2-cyclic phosphodiesterase
VRVWVLGSGSRGNAVLLESSASCILIDAGFPAPVLAQRLALIGVSPEAIEAVVVTHEHHDHARGVRAGVRRWRWAVHTTEGTAAGLEGLDPGRVHRFTAGATIELDGLVLQSIPIPHDAAEPVAFVATDRDTGARAGIVYDVGHASAALRTALVDLDTLVLEANHDEGMLRAGPYPPSVRHRIAGPRGHLSNRAAAELAASCAHRGLRHVVLAHLSDPCNDPALAVRTVRGALAPTAFRGLILPARQDRVVGPFGGRLRERQLTLAL